MLDRRILTENQADMLAALTLPLQLLGGTLLDSAQRAADAQWEFARAYNRFVIDRWREALQIEDADSLRRFWDSHGLASRDLLNKFDAHVHALAELARTGATIAGQLAR